MGTGTKADSLNLIVVGQGTTTLSLGASDTSVYVDIPSYRLATDYSANLLLTSSSPKFSYKPGYHVFSGAGVTSWGIRALFDTSGPFGADINGYQVYAVLRIFVERVSTSVPSVTPTFKIDYYFTNQNLTLQ